MSKYDPTKEHLILTVNFYKETGKWAYTAKVPISEEKLVKLKKEDEWGFDKVHEYIRESQSEVVDESFRHFHITVTLSNIFGTEEYGDLAFCKYMRFPVTE